MASLSTGSAACVLNYPTGKGDRFVLPRYRDGWMGFWRINRGI